MYQHDSPKTHFYSESYDTKERFISYWHQINEIMSLNPKNILEIGVGNKFVSKYLKEKGYNITTFDIIEDLNPDFLGNVLHMPFHNNSFDLVSCCEVLEHLPYQDFSTALSEIFRVTKLHTVLSLPDVTRNFRFLLKIPKIKEPLRIFITVPKLIKRKHEFNSYHYWEIGKRGYPLSKIINDMHKAGFTIEKTYRIFEYPYHRFFILKKPL